MVYAHANGKTLDDTVAAVAHQQKLGYKAIRAQCGIPGLEHAYGIAKGDTPYEPAEKGRPLETVWSTEALPGLRAVGVRAAAQGVRLRRCTCCTTCTIASRRSKPAASAKSLEPHRLFWMEDPVPAELQESFRLIRQHTTTPIAVGEVFNTIYDCHLLIQEHLIDYIRTTVTHAGGISHLRKIAALAELHHVRTGSHGATDLSPVAHGGGAALRSQRAQLRHPGAHAARRGLRSRVPARLLLPGRLHAPRRRAGPRRGHRRGAGRRRSPTSAPTCRSTGRSMGRCIRGDRQLQSPTIQRSNAPRRVVKRTGRTAPTSLLALVSPAFERFSWELDRWDLTRSH